jgi:hypothetical protein
MKGNGTLINVAVKIVLAVGVIIYGVGGYTLFYWMNSTFFKLPALESPYVRLIVITVAGWLGLVLCIASHDTLVNKLFKSGSQDHDGKPQGDSRMLR